MDVRHQGKCSFPSPGWAPFKDYNIHFLHTWWPLPMDIRVLKDRNKSGLVWSHPDISLLPPGTKPLCSPCTFSSNFHYQQMVVGGTGHKYRKNSVALCCLKFNFSFLHCALRALKLAKLSVLWGTCNSLSFSLQIKREARAKILPVDTQPTFIRYTTQIDRLWVNSILSLSPAAFSTPFKFLHFSKSNPSQENEVSLPTDDVQVWTGKSMQSWAI